VLKKLTLSDILIFTINTYDQHVVRNQNPIQSNTWFKIIQKYMIKSYGWFENKIIWTVVNKIIYRWFVNQIIWTVIIFMLLT